MMSDSIDMEKVEAMYRRLRVEEWKNDRTGVYDDKKMVTLIENYLIKQAKKEVGEN